MLLWLAVVCLYIYAAPTPAYFLAMAGLAPALVFVLLAWMAKKSRLRQRTAAIISIALVPLFLVFGLFHTVCLTLDAALSPTTNPAKYASLLEDLHYPDNRLIAHFPAKIPEDAEDVELSHNHAFLQGGENFSLCFRANREYIAAEAARFSSKAGWFGSHEDAKRAGNEAGWMHFPMMSSAYTLPEENTIYLLYSRPHEESGKYMWNHGESCCVVINEEEGRILYQMDDW